MNFPKRRKRISDWRYPLGVIGPKGFMAFSGESAISYAEIHLAGTEQEEVGGYVQKEILRTGSWPVIPTRGGIVKKPLTIVRDGVSNREQGVIAMSEVVENFKRVGQRVQIPLTDTDDDHKNTLRLNTGFVTDLWIVDRADGDSRLVAKMQFTETDVKDKVLNGTYADVSCGIPWHFASRGESYGAVLEHVAITNRPFIDDLGPFLALSDGPETVKREVSHFTVEQPAPVPPAPAPPVPEAPPQVRVVDPFGGLSIRQVMEQAASVLPEAMRETFQVIDVKANGIVIQNDEARMAWRVPFGVEEGKLVSSTDGWAFLTYEGEAKPLAEKSADPSPTPDPPERQDPVLPESAEPVERELEAARRIREARLGVAASSSTKKEGNMPLSREELEALNLSEMPESQRAAIQKLLEDNSTLTASSRESDAEKRITELSDLGLKDKPGALKLYRRVMLGDDGSPAVVVLSDDGKKEGKTALSILDDFIEAIKGAEGKVHLSDQAHLVPDDKKPPATPDGEKKPLSERLSSAKEALAGVNGS